MPLPILHILPLVTAKLERRFKAKLVRAGHGCIEFTGYINPDGYGTVAVCGGNKRILAHRLAWVVANGCEVPDGKIICHRCNNRKCCNPKHLYAGTLKENVADRIKANWPLSGVKGPDHPRSKYRGEARRQAILMRSNAVPFAEIAQAIGCNRQTVERWWGEHLGAMAVAMKLRG